MANNDIEYKTYTVQAGEESESGSSINTLIKISGELKTERDILTKLNPSYTYNEVLKVGTTVLYSVGAMTDTVSSFKVATLKITKSKTNANGQFLYTYSITKLDGSIVKVATDVPGVVGGSYNNDPNISLDTIVAKSKEWYGKKLDVKTLQNLNPNISTQMAYIPNNTTVLLEVCAPGTGNSVDIAKFGLVAGDSRNAYVRWEWDHETNKTEGVEVWWSWQSTDGQWWTGSKSTITDKELFEDTYNSTNDNAVAVKVVIKPITKTGTNTSTKYEWSTECVLNFVFQHWGSFTPSAPQVEIEKYKLTVKYDSLDISDITYEYQGKTYTTKNVTHVQFKVYKNDETKPFKFTDMFPVGLAGEVSYSCSVTAGSKYRAQARCCRITQRGNVYSPWSDLSSFTNTLPIAPALSETKIMNENSVRFKWSKIESATKYILEYAIKDENIYSDFNSASDYFSAISQSGLIKRVEINALDVSLDTSGKVVYKLAYIENGTYLARVKSVNETESKWSNILEFILGRLPDAPTTWSSTTTVGVGEPLTLYWVHNSTDGSEETSAKITTRVDDGTPVVYVVKYTSYTKLSDICSENNVTIDSVRLYNDFLEDAPAGAILAHGTLVRITSLSYVLIKEDEKELTSFFKVNTNSYSDGGTIKWKVQTAGALKDSGGSPAYGAESMERTIDVYAPPSLEVYLLKYDDSYLDEALNTLPLKVTMVSGNTSSNQKPTGYYVSVVAQSDHTSIDEVGNEISVLKGDKVFSKYYDVSDIEYDIELTAKDLTLVNNQSYKVVCSVAMSSGLMAEAESNVFSVSWVGSGIVPNAEVGIDKDTLTARIRPFANDKTGNSVGNIVNLFVYRREYDGTFTEIVTDTNDPDSGIENDQMTWITDPHPSLDYARYRIVARDKNTGIISYYDTSFAVQEKSVVIQWDEAWQSFDAVDGDVIMTNTEKSYTGSMLKLPYNIDVSNVHSPDVALVRYIGRKRPVSYYGTQLGETATWNVAIPKSDAETVYALRRLAIYMGNVYVREPSGSGYWASINISFSRRHLDLTIPVTINITPVEGGM